MSDKPDYIDPAGHTCFLCGKEAWAYATMSWGDIRWFCFGCGLQHISGKLRRMYPEAYERAKAEVQ